MNFVHLNVHSHYSRGWGIGTIEELCRSAKEQGMDRLALTDTNGFYGLVYFIQTAKEMGIQPIVGSELMADEHRAVLLVRNREGYANLCRIISGRQCHQDFDLIKSLRERRKGLIIFSDDFTLLKALKRDSKKDLFVEMSPGYNMAGCYAFSRKSLQHGRLLCLFPQERYPPSGHQPGLSYQGGSVSASPDSPGRSPEQQAFPPEMPGHLQGAQFFECPPVHDRSISPCPRSDP